MPSSTGHEGLAEHLHRSSRLTPSEALRLIQEVLSYFSETPAEFVARRHRELRSEGITNAAIYEAIGVELEDRRFASPPLTARQIRRLIYG